MDRNKIDKKYQWDLTKIFKSSKEFNQLFEEVKENIKDFSKYEKTMDKNATNFYNTINSYYEISRKLEKLAVYTSLQFDTDTSNNKNQSLKMKVSNLYDEWSKINFFVVPTILKKEYTDIEKYYKEEPKLKEYETVLKREFRYKEHTLTDAEEKLLSNMTKIFNNDYITYELLKDSDMTFDDIEDENNKKVKLTCSNYSIYIK